MVNLLLAIFSSAMVSIIMRLSSDKVSGNVSMLAANYLACMAVAWACAGFGDLLPGGPGQAGALVMGGINGAAYLASFVLLQISVKRNGVVLSACFMKLGLLVPMVLSVFLFGEMPGIAQSVGFVIAIGAIVLINSEKSENAADFKLGLVLLLLIGGTGDAMSKVFEQWGDPALSSQFLFYIFASAFVLCLGLLVYKKERPGKPELLYGCLIGIPNYFSSRFLLKALEELSAVIVYPTYSVACIFVVTLAGVVLFRERLRAKQWTAIAAIAVALLLLNL